MIYIGALMILSIAWIIGKADDRRYKRSQKACEKVHQRMYDLIDEHFAGMPAHARAYKADADTFIHGVWKEAGKDYRTTGLKEVTTAKERRERIKAVESGEYDSYKAHALERAEILDAIDRTVARRIAADSTGDISRESGIENMTQDLVDNGMGYDEAKAKAETFRKAMESLK